ncbi:MAG: response regulator transcription factor [Dysgonamonadaceae bacterium]|jgi:DNA-binding response OmpR family regulator|nr:response regulator transcription factor [Dysgonamonadaceae bacterium]
MIKLLLIEDDSNLSYIIKSSLEEIIGGYQVTLASNGKEGLALWKSFCPEVIVSDIEMPVMNGLEMVGKIRQTDPEIPIVFATSKTMSKDVISGYEAGVNNYIKKPFLPEELDAHIKALINLRNSIKVKMKGILHQIGKYRFDPKNFYLVYNSERRVLTTREAQILELLVENKGEVVEREDILLRFWGKNDFYTSRCLDRFITKIRHCLSKDPSIRIINVKAVGLILDFDV